MKYLTMSRHVAVASVVAASLALSACGGGGGDDTTATVESELAKARAETVRLQGLLAAANERIGDATQPDSLLGMIATQTARATGLQNQLDDANGTIGSEDDPNSLLGRLAAEQEKATGLQNQLNAANDLIGTAEDSDSLRGMIADLNEQLKEANDQIGSADDPDSLLGMLAAEQKKATDLQEDLNKANAMIGSADQTAEPDEDGNFPEGTSLYAQLNHYKEDAKKLKDLMAAQVDAKDVAKAKAVNMALRLDNVPAAPSVEVTASTAGVLSAKSTGYTDAAEAPDVGGLPSGWSGRMLTRDGSMLVVYSDIENSLGTPLGALYDSETINNVRSYKVSRGADTSSIMWTHVRRPDGVDSTETVGTTVTHSFKGTARGVAGTFLCTVACDAPRRNANGTVSPNNAPGTWSFRPDDPNALASVADTSYVTVGWSLVDNEDNTYSYDAFATSTGAAHAGAAQEDASVAGSNLSGSASYTGGAAGKYTLLDEFADTAHGGHWTATAKLVANFDADADGIADNNDADNDGVVDDTAKTGVSVSGSLSDFMVDGASQSAWSVLTECCGCKWKLLSVHTPTTTTQCGRNDG